MVIKHIVLSGGGYLGLYELGVLQYLNDNKFFNHENLKSIYGTSIGSLISTIICLNITWKDIIQYFEERPWYKLIQITSDMIINIIQQKGLFDEDIIKNILMPFFKSKNLQENITLLEFYEYTNIELYVYAVDINKYTSVELSYKSFPNLPVIKAIYMSCCIPYVCKPVWYNNTYYNDGGLLNNYPIKNCIARITNHNLKLNTTNTQVNSIKKDDIIENENIYQDKHDITSTLLTDEILGIKFDTIQAKRCLDENSNIFEYGYYLTKKIIKTRRNTSYPHIKNEIVISCTEQNIHDGYNVLHNAEKRKEYIAYGKDCAKIFLSSL